MQTGLDVFLAKEYKRFQKMRLGVVCNQASNDSELVHISTRVLEKKFGLKVTCFFGPQHGIRGEKQDNMIESYDFIDSVTGLPVHSLYGTSRDPSDESLQKIDAFLVDLQDVGTRIYTFMYTMANCMRAAKRTGKKVIVLDRPNPIGGIQLEGNVLEPGFTSFVGQFPMATRHGFTMGELALFFNKEHQLDCDLEIIEMKGWSRKKYWNDCFDQFVPPSPNMPSLDAAIAFPGMVHFEGTNVSEGRGTTKPFEWIGAPFIEPDRLAKEMNAMKLKGVHFRPCFFQPTYQKGKDEVCGGVQIHILDRAKFNSFQAGVRLLAKIAELFPQGFQWKKPPYEYEHTRMPIDLITGSAALREAVDARKGTEEFEEQAETQLAEYKKIWKEYLIYREK